MKTSSQPAGSAGLEWKSGWGLVLASSVGFSFFSVMISATGLFMEPLQKEFGWSRTVISSGPSIASLIQALLGPFFGLLVDRYGTRPLTIPGLVLTIAVMASFGLVNGSTTMWMGLWMAFGIVSVSIKSTGWTTAVVGKFTTSRGLALALTLGGTALSQTLVPPLGNYLINTFGWRSAFVWLAFGWGGVALVLCVLLFHDANDRLRRGIAGQSSDKPEPAILPGLTVPQALRNPALWCVAISNFVVMLLTMGLTIHLFPILTEAGVSRSEAAWLVSLGGISAIVGKILTGYLLDRYRPNWIGAITLGTASVVFLLLLDGIRSFPLIIIAMIVNGYAQGTKTQITGYLTAGYAGMRNFGAIYGVMSALMALAAGLGPLLGGLAYDLTGGYGPFLIAGAIGCALGGFIVATLPSYPSFEPEGDLHSSEAKASK